MDKPLVPYTYPRFTAQENTLWTFFSSYYRKAQLRASQTSNYLLGGFFRDTLLMPLNKRKSDTQRQKASKYFFDPTQSHSPTRIKVLNAFTITTSTLYTQCNSIHYHLKINRYEINNQAETVHTCLRVGGNDEDLDASNFRLYPLLKETVKQISPTQGLRIVQFSFYGQERKAPTESDFTPWQPTCAKEIGDLFFHFLQEWQTTQHIQIDSLFCHSFGSIIFEGLDTRPSLRLPKTLILDRPLSSVWKVGQKLYYPFISYPLYTGAYLAGWSADPENGLVKFFAKCAKEDLLNQQLVLLEVKSDHYFSGVGAFDQNFAQSLTKLGLQRIYRHSFEPNKIEFHERSHHALTLNHLKNGDQPVASSFFSLQPYESAASALVKCLLASFPKEHFPKSCCPPHCEPEGEKHLLKAST